MYPSMKNELAGAAFKKYLDSRTQQTPGTDSFKELLDIAQTQNYFEFGDEIRVQSTGAATGQKQAPPYYCLGAAKMGEDKIYPNEQFQEFIFKDTSTNDEKDRWWHRFIDDILAVTTMSQEQAEDFVSWMNSKIKLYIYLE